MRWLLPIFMSLLGTVAGTALVQAQLGGGLTDRPIPVPPLASVEAPGLSTNPLRYLDGLSAKPDDDLLKSLDKELGRSSTTITGDPPRDRPLEGPRPRPGEDLEKEHAPRSTF
jgi:hypothetical protein